MHNFWVVHNTIGKLIRETCEVMSQEFTKEFIPNPKTPAAWKDVANKFSMHWQFHNCLGAFDCKHIAMKSPPQCGFHYIIYKLFHSIDLLDLADANYKFLHKDVGANDNACDGEILQILTFTRP
jgi:hypothetical protein